MVVLSSVLVGGQASAGSQPGRGGAPGGRHARVGGGPRRPPATTGRQLAVCWVPLLVVAGAASAAGLGPSPPAPAAVRLAPSEPAPLVSSSCSHSGSGSGAVVPASGLSSPSPRRAERLIRPSA